MKPVRDLQRGDVVLAINGRPFAVGECVVRYVSPAYRSGQHVGYRVHFEVYADVTTGLDAIAEVRT